MTNEEIERAIEFVVNQQARFAEDQQKLATDIRGLADAHVRTERTLGTTVEVLGRIAETQLEMAEAQKRTDEALAETNERLNSLIVVVERYFSNGRGNQ
jgi:proline dehydrogenase